MSTIDPDRLFLHEQIILLSLRDAEGTFIGGTNAKYAVAGAALSELFFTGRVDVEGEGRKERVVLRDETTTGDAVLDDCLALVKDSKPRAPRDWISRFANQSGLLHRIAQGLARRGILRADEEKVLLIFSRRIYPEVDPEPERVLLERIREAVLGDDEAIDPAVAMVVAVAHGANLLRYVFEKAELKGAAERLDRIVKGDLGGSATKAAVQAMQAAVMSAVIASSVAASAAAAG